MNAFLFARKFVPNTAPPALRLFSHGDTWRKRNWLGIFEGPWPPGQHAQDVQECQRAFARKEARSKAGRWFGGLWKRDPCEWPADDGQASG